MGKRPKRAHFTGLAFERNSFEQEQISLARLCGDYLSQRILAVLGSTADLEDHLAVVRWFDRSLGDLLGLLSDDAVFGVRLRTFSPAVTDSHPTFLPLGVAGFGGGMLAGHAGRIMETARRQ